MSYGDSTACQIPSQTEPCSSDCSSSFLHSLQVLATSDSIASQILQGDREKKEGLPVSPQCDREQVNAAKSQIVFLERVVKPCYNAIKLIAPKSATLALQHVEQAKEHWEKVLAEEAQDTTASSQ